MAEMERALSAGVRAGGAVNIVLIADQLRVRHRLSAPATADLVEHLMQMAQARQAAIEFDPPARPWRAH